MTPMLNPLTWVAAKIFSLALRLFPPDWRREYASEMQIVFNLCVEDTARRGGWRVFLLALREVRDLPGAVASTHTRTIRGMMNAYIPSQKDQTPWIYALISLLPMIISGPVQLYLSYQPGWSPREGSILYLGLLACSTLLLAIGLVWGAVFKFPRWVYPYVVMVPFSMDHLTGYAHHLYPWLPYQQNIFSLTLVIILAVFCLPGLRIFYQQIAQDWTRLSYGLFGIVLFLLGTVDFDEVPTLSLITLLPTLLPLVSALAHLKIPFSLWRVAVLLAGLYSGLIFWLSPLFTGMISLWVGILIGLVMILLYAIIMTIILLSPLAIPFIQNRRASRG